MSQLNPLPETTRLEKLVLKTKLGQFIANTGSVKGAAYVLAPKTRLGRFIMETGSFTALFARTTLGKFVMNTGSVTAATFMILPKLPGGRALSALMAKKLAVRP